MPFKEIVPVSMLKEIALVVVVGCQLNGCGFVSCHMTKNEPENVSGRLFEEANRTEIKWNFFDLRKI